MPSLRFLQLSDVHLDSSLNAGRLGLSAAALGTRRTELRQVFTRACDLVRERRLQIVLLPGDLFDDEAVTQDTVNFVIDALAELSPVPVVISPGNHDYYSLGSPYNNELLAARKQRPWPDNVHVFRSGGWSTHTFPTLPFVEVTGMAHCAGAALGERLLARPIPRPARAPDRISLLVFHGSRDNVRIPGRKLRTLPFSDAELAAQRFDYAAIGHYHEHATIAGSDGRVIGSYSGCPAGRGLDETGERYVLTGEILLEGGESLVELEKVRLDPRAVRCIEVGCQGASHREALLRRVEQAIEAAELSSEDLVHIRLTGRIAPGIDPRLPEGVFEDRFFSVSYDTSLLKPDYNLERYRDEAVRTTEARFAREMLRRLEAEPDAARRRILESALYYGLDALVQKDVAPRYED